MPDDAIERAREAIAAGLRSWIADTHDVDLSRKMICDAVDHIVAQPGLLAFASQQAPGMVLVPREPTPEMLHGAMTASRLSDPSPLPSCKELWAARQVWSAMLDAAPSVTLGEVG